MTELELKKIIGGGSISGSLINSISRLFGTVLDIGRTIGSAINYFIHGRKC